MSDILNMDYAYLLLILWKLNILTTNLQKTAYKYSEYFPLWLFKINVIKNMKIAQNSYVILLYCIIFTVNKRYWQAKIFCVNFWFYGILML